MHLPETTDETGVSVTDFVTEITFILVGDCFCVSDVIEDAAGGGGGPLIVVAVDIPVPETIITFGVGADLTWCGAERVNDVDAVRASNTGAEADVICGAVNA